MAGVHPDHVGGVLAHDFAELPIRLHEREEIEVSGHGSGNRVRPAASVHEGNDHRIGGHWIRTFERDFSHRKVEVGDLFGHPAMCSATLEVVHHDDLHDE